MFTDRQIMLSRLRAEWVIKTQLLRQIERALETLENARINDTTAIEVANMILEANIGP